MWITFEWLLPTISGLFSLYRWLCASSDVLESDTRTFDACHSDQSRHREVTEQARQRVDCMVWFSGVCCKFYTAQLWNSFFWQQGGRAMHLPSQSRACSCTPILNAVLIPMPLQGWRFPHVAIRPSMSWQVMLHYCISVRVTLNRSAAVHDNRSAAVHVNRSAAVHVNRSAAVHVNRSAYRGTPNALHMCAGMQGRTLHTAKKSTMAPAKLLLQLLLLTCLPPSKAWHEQTLEPDLN